LKNLLAADGAAEGRHSALQRFYVIDALRSVLALCVAIGHLGMFPLFGPSGQPDAFWDLAARGFRTLVFGPPAVIAFFVISGFCIHYPFAATKHRCPILPFYARRYIRIVIPVAATLAIFKIVFPATVIVGADSILWHSTLWSVLCEEIYYAMYPFLNRMAPRLGWPRILAVAFGLSMVVIWYGFPATDWQDVGILVTALTLLPIWLLGCYLAENISSLKAACAPWEIWIWRLCAWAAMWIALMLHFHTPIHQTLSGVPIGILCYFWLRAEIGYSNTKKPWNILVWAGRWSYSLYLIHPIAVGVLVQYGLFAHPTRLGWLLALALVLLSAYVFYLAVERPSHRLARKIPLLRREPVGEGTAFIKI
jgi:peptidoglycan/LPS O-acetylase OafA/YrhL